MAKKYYRARAFQEDEEEDEEDKALEEELEELEEDNSETASVSQAPTYVSSKRTSREISSGSASSSSDSISQAPTYRSTDRETEDEEDSISQASTYKSESSSSSGTLTEVQATSPRQYRKAESIVSSNGGNSLRSRRIERQKAMKGPASVIGVPFDRRAGGSISVSTIRPPR